MDTRLNVDVLTIVIQFLTDCSDVFSFSLVSSSLRPIAVKRLLSIRHVSLRRDVSFRNFHTFLFANALTHARHIRALHVGGRRFPHQLIPNQPSGFSSLAVDIISSCTRLDHVTMFFEQGPTDEDEPIVLAITALKSLRSLTVGGWSGDTLRLLRHLSSPIRKLAINSTYVRHLDVLEEFLPRLARTLEELELLYFSVDRGRTSSALKHASGNFLSLTQYPAVRSLSVLCFMGTPLVDRLQHLFPALDGTLSLGFFDTLLDTCLIDDVRSANQRAQEGSAAGVWKKLDRVVCDAPMLYALGLRCPIRLVMLDKGSADADADTAHYAAAALRENPVPRLKLTLTCGRGMLDGIFTPQLAGTLSHLTLCLVHDSRDGSSGTLARDADDSVALWDDLLDIMLTVLRPLHNLTHLRIVVSCHKAYTRPGVPAESSSSFVASLRGSRFDFAGTAASLVRARQSLRYVFLTTAGSLTDRDRDVAAARPWRATHERWDVSRAWRVAGCDGGGANPNPNSGAQDGTGDANASVDLGLGLVELHGDVAETIVRNEELVLSETDEATLFSSNLKEAQREVSGIGADE